MIKKQLTGFLSFVIRHLNGLLLRLNNKEAIPDLTGFEDLAPTINHEETKVYTKALIWALNNKNIKNIGLTGPYGSGKSSILKTFIDGNPDHTYLNISLASFDDEAGKSQGAQQIIELSIMQQIFYREAGKDIPDSRFKRIKSLKGRELFLKSIAFIAWLTAGLCLFKPGALSTNIHLRNLVATQNGAEFYISVIVFSVGAVIFVNLILRMLNKTRLQKLSLTSGEFEIDKKEETSILNKHLDEIIYFFEITKYDVVIIEDLDRFKEPDIFTKLREINLLLNNSKQIHRKIVFVYAIKDDMFFNANRTKFFEFLIPVIPIINFSNSGEILQSKLSLTLPVGKDTEEFVNDIGFYIEDMRMVKNIVNEYLLYNERIGSGLDRIKLLAIIIYKNMYPTDFSDLHLGKGLVHGMFAQKAEMIKTELDALMKQIAVLKKQIEVFEKMIPRNEHELRAIYIQGIIDKIGADDEITAIRVSGQKTLIGSLNSDTVFNSISRSTGKIFYFGHYGMHESEFSFSDIEKFIDPGQTYVNRMSAVQQKSNGEIEKIKSRINSLEQDSNNIQWSSLVDILSRVDPTALNPEIATKKLLLYLLRNGYINEMYPSYISYFYEGNITRGDFEFIMSVKNREPLPFTFELSKMAQLIGRLRPKEFLQKETLNYNLLVFLLSSASSYPYQLDNIFRQLTSAPAKSLEFIDGFLKIGNGLASFIPMLCKYWVTIWVYIQESSDFTSGKREFYLQQIILYLETDKLLDINFENVLTKSIENCSNFLFLFTDSTLKFARIKNSIKALKVSFKELRYNELGEKLFQFIYSESLYAINSSMISLIMEKNEKPVSAEIATLKYTSYSRIMESGCTQLISYLNVNIDDYARSVLLKEGSLKEELPKYVLSLLKNENLPINDRILIVEEYDVLNIDLDELPEELWDTLIEKSKIKSTWYNLLIYFKKAVEMTPLFVGYLNRDSNISDYLHVLSEEKTASLENWEELEGDFTRDFITSSDINDRNYQAFIERVDFVYDDLDISDLQEDRVSKLVVLEILIMTPGNFQMLKSHYKSLHILLLHTHISQYLVDADKYSLDGHDFFELLQYYMSDVATLQSIIEKMPSSYLTNDKELNERICEIVLQYPNTAWQFLLIHALLLNVPNLESKLNLVAPFINRFNFSEITAVLEGLGDKYQRLAKVKNKEVRFDNTPQNHLLLTTLRQKNYITSIKVKGGHLIARAKIL